MDLQGEDVGCTTVKIQNLCLVCSLYISESLLKNAGINVTTYLTDAVQWKNGKPVVMYHLLQCQRQIQ